MTVIACSVFNILHQVVSTQGNEGRVPLVLLSRVLLKLKPFRHTSVHKTLLDELPFLIYVTIYTQSMVISVNIMFNTKCMHEGCSIDIRCVYLSVLAAVYIKYIYICCLYIETQCHLSFCSVFKIALCTFFEILLCSRYSDINFADDLCLVHFLMSSLCMDSNSLFS